MKKLLLLIIFILGLATIVQAQDCSAAASLQTHIYHPDRLVPTDKGCITLTGKILAKVPEKDGDLHYRMRLDRGQGAGLINSKNRLFIIGHLEIIICH